MTTARAPVKTLRMAQVSMTLIRTMCLIVMSTCVSLQVAAQPLYGVVHRPGNVKYDVLSSEHFEVIYQRGFDRLARRVAAVASEANPVVVRQAGLDRPLRVPIVINAFNDASNGFVSPFPFRVEIEAPPIKGKILNPRHEDWIAQVVPHELAHAAQAEIRGGFGIGDFVRLLSPDWARALNLGAPRGITEGFAVWHESQGPRSVGRLNFSFTRMQARALAESNPWSLSEVFDPPGYTRPLNRFYIGGGLAHTYLVDSVSTDFLVNSARFYNRWPFLGFGIALWHATGKPTWSLSHDFQRYQNEMSNPTAIGAGETASEIILADEDGLECRRPTWISSSRLVAYCSGYQHDPGIYRFDVKSGEEAFLSRESITEDYYLTFDRSHDQILFAQYRPLGFGVSGFESFIKAVNVQTGASTSLAGTRRWFAPTRMPDGSLVALTNRGQETLVVGHSPDRSKTDTLFDRKDLRVLETHAGSDDSVVVLANGFGNQSLFMAQVKDGEFGTLRHLLSSAEGSVYDPVRTPDKTAILFTADPEGVANIYKLSLQDGWVTQLTDARYGAYEPSVSEDGQSLAYVDYQYGRSRIVVEQWRPDAPDVSSAFVRTAPTTTIPADTMNLGDVKPYRPFPSFLKPRVLAPFLRFRESKLSAGDRRLGPGFGASLFGADVLQQWAYSVTGFHQEDRLWGRLSVQTGNHLLRPFITVSDLPRSGVRFVEGLPTRVAFQERSIEIGASVPIRLSANAENTGTVIGGSMEYRGVRLLAADASPISAFDKRLSANPVVEVNYKIRRSLRDIIPSNGIRIVSRAEVDLQTEEAVKPSRAWRTNAEAYLPFAPAKATGVSVRAGVLWQNRGSILNVSSFLPPGYDDDEVFLADGVFFTAGAEVVQPLAYIDQGILLIPINLQALYLYGFAETLGRTMRFREPYSSIGGGLGAHVLFGHHINLNLRVGFARLLEEDSWAVTFR